MPGAETGRANADLRQTSSSNTGPPILLLKRESGLREEVLRKLEKLHEKLGRLVFKKYNTFRREGKSPKGRKKEQRAVEREGQAWIMGKERGDAF